MDLPEEAIADLSATLGIALSYIFLAAYHHILSTVLGGLVSLFLRHVLLQTSLYLYPAFWIHASMFWFMTDTLEWIRAAWTLVTQDGPPEGVPGAEVANVVTKGLLLVLYVINAFMWMYAIPIIFAIWDHIIFVFCSGIGLAALLPLSAISFRWFGDRERVELYKNDSLTSLGLRLLFTGVLRVGVGSYKVLSGAVQKWADITTYLSEFSRRLPERYQQTSPEDVYIYKALNPLKREIRLIKLKRNPFTGICSTLETYPLESPPRYEAISYTWGVPIKDHLVFFDGRWLPTTQNVYRIFQDRSSFFRTRWLWVDAVCINQADDEEKSVQVNMMGEIYHTAERVIVWLGDKLVPSSEVTSAMFLLENFNYNIRNYGDRMLKLDSLQFMAGTHDSWEALGRLLTHPYWQRTWIVQEIAKARVVHILYGGRYISWDFFSLMLQGLGAESGKRIMAQELIVLKNDVMGLLSGVIQISAIWVMRETLAKGKPLALEDALSFTHKCMATDSRDKVFALGNMVSLINITEQTDIRPDYGLTVHQVYIRTARYILSRQSNFILLQCGIGYKRSISDLPSWVPDWTTRQPQSNETGGSPGQAYNACGPGPFKSALATLSPNLLEISIQAMRISKIGPISSVGYSAPASGQQIKHQTPQSFYQAAHSIAFSHCLEVYTLTKQSRAEAFWRTLIGDRHQRPNYEPGVWPRFQWPANPEYEEHFQVWRNGILGLGFGQLSNDQVNDTNFAFSRALANACGVGTRFAVTEEGLMALVPPLTEVGDVVVLVAGFAKPVLLRGGCMDGNKWRLVGDCYVHGVMGGELWDDGKRATEVTIW